MVEERDVDLFAGPGGWEEGAAALGVRPLGIEWDDAACATRRARGHETLQADVSALDPVEFAPVRLMIASPPCQAFSMAGLGAGRAALLAYIDAIAGLLETGVIDHAPLDEKCADPRGHLVLEPLRWAMQLRPRFVALEQVEPVLPLWEAIAEALARLGYDTWTGVLSAERYGVPQTRRRAILLAKLDGVVSEPPATHQRYVAPRVRAKQEESLFDAPEPERIVAPEDRGLLPWVSMAEALGWGMTARPYPVLACSSDTGGPDLEKVGGSGARAALYGEQEAGRWAGTFEPNGRRTDLGRGRPDGTWVTEKTRSAVRMRANAQAKACERSVDEPAPTIKGGHDTADRVWTHDRPATTVAGDPRVFPPGHKLNEDDVRAGRTAQHRSGAGSSNGAGEPEGPGAVRVSVEEAAVLQSFPADYPWQGTRTAQFRQIGDAVPPLLARAILSHLLR